jgi:hypothetical protein
MSWSKEQIHALLDQNATAVGRAVKAIHARQTGAEAACGVTQEQNGVGWSKFDAEPMTRYIMFMDRGYPISARFLAFARRRVKRYWRQLAEVANERALVANGLGVQSIAVAEPIGSAVRPAVKVLLRCDCENGDGEPDAVCPENCSERMGVAASW